MESRQGRTPFAKQAPDSFDLNLRLQDCRLHRAIKGKSWEPGQSCGRCGLTMGEEQQVLIRFGGRAEECLLESDLPDGWQIRDVR
ncbi:hypothetical protein COV53_00980 [Candidatus Gottesmanbacteria bacterium CG11_big_fil_rev_8_21_14_0_20_37_11]|uniref:Uncharacterized protein n=3 Tax=Candidatus Gottesmaniibacteriota TaxID=1752720 RepID=A0A2M7RTF5_9BACT|nr:MAG: hypothetical protein AUJ73_03175 [Candidatus Gottesmanbacteria bacterium CG1_02_37_22]PIP33302.1 MAG: hypothetical protein COX23_00045 [Candidatus Gottesmanbacteria bacterium CG23_combo_of_CG06-09_8_20_14_all_37_19]PIR08808.1 MAG: hypothetical protein COV53_00980 [Candidatus Gottesmanbacteria bacterium CG11_big_fil_rev_8_21_14_0_20_37_11]PIZ03339.1 MAG: hypothetical protein COY59_00090 [Candidatus Gottesmanbacteria bacterium CG_4_10_14_0_8_um_filter_37_24]